MSETEKSRIPQARQWLDIGLLRRSAILSAAFHAVAVVLHYTGYYTLFRFEGVLRIWEIGWGWVTLVAFLYLSVKATEVAANQVMAHV